LKTEFIEAVVISVLGSGAFATLATALINALSNRKSKLKKIEGQLTAIDQKLIKSEKDTLRTQLLIMLSDYPDEVQEIMIIAQHYFGDLKGDWYATSLFNRWITENNIAEPSWFDSKK
jgi:hypothetical protein